MINRNSPLTVTVHLPGPRLQVFCKKRVLKISQNLQQKTSASGLQLFLKRDTVTRESFKDTFFDRTSPVVASGLFF